MRTPQPTITTLLSVLALGSLLPLSAQQDEEKPAPSHAVARLNQNYLAALERLLDAGGTDTASIAKEIAWIKTGTSKKPPAVSGRLATLRKTYHTSLAKIQVSKPADPTPPPPPRTGPNEKWPSSAALPSKLDVKIVTEDPENDKFVYQTPHFEFESEAKLRTTVVREFGRIFEATLHALNQLPLGLELSPPAEKHFKTRLFVTREAYIKAGGPPGSGGVFISRGGTGIILIPLTSLGVEKVGKGYTLTGDDEQHTLVHEITHQCMWNWNRKMNTWYVEGIAEYMAAAPYANGRFKFTNPARAMRDYLKSYKGVWNQAYTMYGAATMLDMNSAQWGAGGIRSYASASIMAQFFHHWDGEGDGRHIRAYLAALKAGTPEPKARQTHLLRGRSIGELEKLISRAWRRADLKLAFAPNQARSGN